ncbi:NnrU family protein [Telmatospirillum sp. J64-1]|uniref:NnrU family protein n=1 Tax=Telmatospirillum sp. J64-1 TaxID=2502183 RepID=UPI00115D45D1|nr:NnrU family protein [Telmatospirillum sp. J64-1]
MTGSLSHLAAAVAAFLLTHALPAARPVRARLVAMMGLRPYLIAYSLLSLAVILWMALAYADAPYVELWFAPWTRWVPNLAMPVAFILGIAALATPNPFSLGPGGKGFDPQNLGILRLTRHPLPWALILWSGSHLLANGDVAALMLFAPLFLLSLSAPALLDRKSRTRLGADWSRLAAQTSQPLRLRPKDVRWWHILLGLVAWAAMLHLHPWLFGVSPLPLF